MNLKKHICTFLGMALISGTSALAAETNIGITLSGVGWEASGTETVKSSGTTNSKSENGIAPLASIFIERVGDTGAVLGLDIVPVAQKIGDGSPATTDDDNETSGSNKVDVEFNKMFTLYAEFPIEIGYLKVGYSHLTIETDETLNTGSTYGDEDTSAILIGLGKKGVMDNGLVWKAEALYQQIQEATFTSSVDSDSVSNKITLDDVDTVQLRFSIAKSF